MPKSYSGDLRKRVIEAVEGGASRHEAAERFEISVSSAVKWLRAWHDHGVSAAKPCGGSVSVLEDYADRILAIIAEQPDRTLNEIVATMRKRRIPGSRSAVWRFLDRHGITFKNACGQPSNIGSTWRERVGAGLASKDILIRHGWCLSTRPRPVPTWSVSGDAVCVASD